MKSNDIKGYVQNMLGDRTSDFITSMVSVVNGNVDLQNCTPESILGSCLKAASLKLPVDPSFGQSYIIPYKDTATFQIGYKGYLQLAIRSGLYRKINVCDIRVGEIVEIDEFNEVYKFSKIPDDKKREDAAVVGYFGFFEMDNFKKSIYWSVEKIKSHAKKYSTSYNSPSSPWRSNFDNMAKKTVLKELLSKWGILSIDIQEALSSDNKKIEYDGNAFEESYVVADNVEIIDTPSKLEQEFNKNKE